MNEKTVYSVQEVSDIRIMRIGFSRPFRWLHEGWQDLMYSPRASLAHGLIITAMGWIVVIFTSNHLYLFTAAISGFMLVGPMLAAGLYELSRRKMAGQLVNFEASLDGLKRNVNQLARFAIVPVAFIFAWLGISALIFKDFFHGDVPALTGAIYQTTWLSGGAAFLLTYGIVGGAMAVTIFVLSVISVPMIMDRGTEPAVAIVTSVKVVGMNIFPMLLWAALLVALTLIGLLTQLWGMVLIIPLLGHATWHAYKDTVG